MTLGVAGFFDTLAGFFLRELLGELAGLLAKDLRCGGGGLRSVRGFFANQRFGDGSRLGVESRAVCGLCSGEACAWIG